MASEAVKEFTDSNFDQEVMQSDTPVLVDFWAEWCMPCRTLTPTIDELADEFDQRVKVGKVNVDDNREVALKFGISAIPTILLFKGGEVVKKFVGVVQKSELASEMTSAAE